MAASPFSSSFSRLRQEKRRIWRVLAASKRQSRASLARWSSKASSASSSRMGQGINVRVLDMATIKPLDNEAVIKAAKETGAIMTIEDHTIFGGLGSAVSEVVVQNCPVPMEIVGIQDKFGESGDPELLYRDHGMDTQSIIAKAKALVARK